MSAATNSAGIRATAPATSPAALTRLEALRQAWRLAVAHATDGLRFWRHSFTRRASDREQMRGRIAMDLHFLEYGMALRAPSVGHGLDKAERLIDDIETYLRRWRADAQTAIAMRALDAHLALNVGHPRATPIRERLDALSLDADADLRGGVEEVRREDIAAAVRGVDFPAFAAARHSIRQFAPDPVPEAALRRAVAAAQQSPSSCNRQTCRLHVWTRPDLVARVVALQSGNRGFGHELGGVAVVWSDLRNWSGAGERASGLVDGGMFAMSFILALHAEGLGTISLNWSEEPAKDRALRRLAALPESAQIVVMVGFGTLPETLRVPVSQRRPVESCLSLDPSLSAG